MLETILIDFVVITLLLFIAIIFIRSFLFNWVSIPRVIIYLFEKLYQIEFVLIILDIPIITYLIITNI